MTQINKSRNSKFAVNVGGVLIGKGNPVRIQSMTDTDSSDIAKTVAQIKELAIAGSEIVRITVNDENAAKSVSTIKKILLGDGFDLPIVGDFHYNGHVLLREFPDCAKALDKYRINPGNVGFGDKKDKQFQEIIKIAIDNDKPIRIGVNWGSIDQDMVKHLMDKNSQKKNPKSYTEVEKDALILSALTSADQAVQHGMSRNKIILSCKVSNVTNLVEIYKALSKKSLFPLHLGLTEAGMGTKGIVSSAAALAILLQENIGDTIRVSITPEVGQSRTQEVKVAQEVLQSMGIRNFTPQVASCPGCGRTTSTFFRELASDITGYISKQMPKWQKKYKGVESMNIAVMGCIVNGPGESKHADIGISLPGTNESPSAPVFIDGQKKHTLKGDNIAGDFKDILEKYVQKRYGVS